MCHIMSMHPFLEKIRFFLVFVWNEGPLRRIVPRGLSTFSPPQVTRSCQAILASLHQKGSRLVGTKIKRPGNPPKTNMGSNMAGLHDRPMTPCGRFCMKYIMKSCFFFFRVWVVRKRMCDMQIWFDPCAWRFLPRTCAWLIKIGMCQIGSPKEVESLCYNDLNRSKCSHVRNGHRILDGIQSSDFTATASGTTQRWVPTQLTPTWRMASWLQCIGNLSSLVEILWTDGQFFASIWGLDQIGMIGWVDNVDTAANF